MGGIVTTAAPTIAAILSDAVRLGVELQAHGDKLRYRPRDRMTPDLADRLKAHRGDVLALLRANLDGCAAIDSDGVGTGLTLDPERLATLRSIVEAGRSGTLWEAVAMRTGLDCNTIGGALLGLKRDGLITARNGQIIATAKGRRVAFKEIQAIAENVDT